jgi:hypothetical protein
MHKIKEMMIIFSVFLMIIQSVSAISNVQHFVDGNRVILTYQGAPPFWINIRGDTNIGQSGGYLWARTYSNSFSYDMSFAINPSKKFYYGVKDNQWSNTNTFVLSQETKKGTILVKKGSVLNQYAINLAQNKGWNLLEVTSSNPEVIRNNIIQLYHQKPFTYLLILGDETQIPIYDKELLKSYILSTGFGFNEEIIHKDENDLDSLYYANIDADLYTELAVGRLPFTNVNDLEKYYQNLPNQKKINKINVLSHLSFNVQHIGWLRPQLASYTGTQYYMVDTISEFNDYLASSDLLYSNNHGNQEGFAIGEYYTLQNVPNLNNKQIIVGDACSAGAKLGPEFLRKGAIAYIGYYVDAKLAGLGLLDQPTNSKTIGELTREVNNFYYFNQLINRGPRTNYYLIGDPSIQLEFNSINKITLKTEDNQLKVSIPSMKDYTFEIPNAGEVTDIYTQYTYQFSATSSTINLLKTNPVYIQGNDILIKCDPNIETGFLLYCRDVSGDYSNSPYRFATVLSRTSTNDKGTYSRLIVRLDKNYTLKKIYELRNGNLIELTDYLFEIVNAEDIYYLNIYEPNTIMLNNIHNGNAYKERTFVFDIA